jgi:hypothetical protein
MTELAPCPIGRDPHLGAADALIPCPVPLQPYRGWLVLGIAAHLTTVHRLPRTAAERIATAWVSAGCRATR